jgi:hypothetical protein
VVVTKLSEVLENINEVMTWLEGQPDNEYLDLLHLVNINQYVLKNFSHQFYELHYMTISVRHKCK